MTRHRTVLRHAILGALALGGLAAAPKALPAQVAVDAQLGGGVALPGGDLGDYTRRGGAGQLALTGAIPFTPFAIRGEGLLAVMPGNAVGVSRTSVVAFGADLLYRFELGALRPYVLLGPAFYRAKFSSGLIGASAPAFIRGGFNAGAGTTIGSGRVRAFVEGSYHALRVAGIQPRFTLVTAGLQVQLRQGRIRRDF